MPGKRWNVPRRTPLAQAPPARSPGANRETNGAEPTCARRSPAPGPPGRGFNGMRLAAGDRRHLAVEHLHRRARRPRSQRGAGRPVEELLRGVVPADPEGTLRQGITSRIADGSAEFPPTSGAGSTTQGNICGPAHRRGAPATDRRLLGIQIHPTDATKSSSSFNSTEPEQRAAALFAAASPAPWVESRRQGVIKHRHRR